ncbi:MAG: prolyl oligopeptidase family serine peptidase [Phycisphaerae bacterium]|jgi:prolyl oligopeptidase
MRRATLAAMVAACLGLTACQVLDPAPGRRSEASRAGSAAATAIVTRAVPPVTQARPVVERLHGVRIRDDYRWLEGDNGDPARMGLLTDEVSRWTDGQNAYTRRVLDGLPRRAELEARLRTLMEVGSVTAPEVRGRRYFYSKREGHQPQASVFMRTGPVGEPRLVLDPATLDASGLTTISWYEPSEDGRLLAFGAYRAGDENSTLRVLDVDAGAMLPLEIPGKVSSLSWMPDASGFVYRNLQDAANPYSGQVMHHAMGRPVAEDKQILRQFRPDENATLATTYGPGGGLSRDGRWLVLSYATDTRNNDLFLADFLAWRTSGKLDRVVIASGLKASFSGTMVGDTLYMLTTLDAPNGRIVAVDPRRPQPASWKVVVPEATDGGVIERLDIGKGVLAVTYLRAASSDIRLFDLSGRPAGALRLPGIGTASVATEPDSTEAFLSFTSYNAPPSIFRVDLTKPEVGPELWERPVVPVDPTSIEVRQEWYRSRDGTRVSMFIVHRKGLKLDGDNPTILYGYGGFKVSLTPSFSPALCSWFEDGGVYAVANIRGGGEYGQAWHEGGRLARKQHVFDDFIAAAEHLIDRRYTRPERLALQGGSNGGLLTGAMVTQRPDLFRAAIVGVPLLDMLRYQQFLMARYWVPEYGSSESAAQFGVLRAYSPYHRIRPGTAYPAVLLTAGENDARVHPLHARKMAAALQAATASDPAERPVLLWVDREAGHGQGKPLHLRVRDAADQRIFLMWQLGMLGD